MIIHDFHIPSMAIAEFEGDPPRSAGRNRPLDAARSTQAMQSHRGETGEVLKTLRLIKKPQAAPGQGLVEARKATLAIFGEALRCPVRP